MLSLCRMTDVSCTFCHTRSKGLKAKQREAITRFVGGEDVFICLPTGFGKSLCYALLPLVFDYLRGSAGHSIVVCTFLQCSGNYSTRTLAGLLSSI